MDFWSTDNSHRLYKLNQLQLQFHTHLTTLNRPLHRDGAHAISNLGRCGRDTGGYVILLLIIYFNIVIDIIFYYITFLSFVIFSDFLAFNIIL